MNILIIGSGGREHILAKTYSKSKKVNKIFVAPGNDFMNLKNDHIIPCPDIAMMDFEGIVKLCKKEKIDIVDAACDEVLAAGLVDVIGLEPTLKNTKAFGPTQDAAELEWNKAWARILMQQYNLPIPQFMYFSNQKEAIKYVKAQPEQLWYVKATGLAAGKGAIRADTKKKAEEGIIAMKQFGKSGKIFLIEEGLVGEEFSLFAICDGESYTITKTAQDHKTVYNSDQGSNTGGMGCIAPASIITPSTIRIIEQKIIKPILKVMKEKERPFSGILYLGGMLTKNEIKIIEFNVRWGDPEAEVIVASIKTDYVEIVNAVINKKLSKLTIDFDQKIRLSIAGCSRGYPNDYSKTKGKEVFGLLEAMKLPGIAIYGAGIKRKNNRFFANGGRVFHLVAEGDTVQQARVRAYGAMAMISIEGNNLHYRTDIGWRDVERMQR